MSRRLILLIIAVAVVGGLVVWRVRGREDTMNDGSWRLVTETSDVEDIVFSDSRHGWMIRRGEIPDLESGDSSLVPGRRGVWLTADGGRTWRLCRGRVVTAGHPAAAPPDATHIANPSSITAVDARTAVIAFQGARGPCVSGRSPPGVVMTRDDGRTWRVCLTLPRGQTIAASSWTDVRHGWVLCFRESASNKGDPWTLWRTRDGGDSWRRIGDWTDYYGFRPDPCPTGMMQFVDRRVGWALFWGGLRRSTDGGLTWRRVKRLPETPAEHGGCWGGYADHYQVLDGRRVLGDRALVPTENDEDLWEGVLYKTVDAGRSWTYRSMDDPVMGVHFVDGRCGWVAVGRHRTVAVLRTTDGGKTWQQQLEQRGWFWRFAAAGDDLVLIVRDESRDLVFRTRMQ